MYTSDVQAVTHWWFTIFLLGFIFLPLTIFLFRKFIDKGYIFSKIIALTLTTYAVFLFGVLHITSFNQASAIFIAVVVAGTSLYVLPQKGQIFRAMRTSWKWFLFEEILFFFALYFWANIHGYEPDIHGLEKYMDYGFINSILRSEYFPPKDMWFTPLYINYYYFGHMMTAVLTRISNLSSGITFNLMLSTIFALCFSQTFSIGANLVGFISKNNAISRFKRIMTGILTACLVTFSGNLHIIYAFFKPYNVDKPQPFWELPFLPATFPNDYWYPNATRYIYHTIHEFPIYSWVVADLHGHVLDIPLVLFIIAFLLSLFMMYDKKETTQKAAHVKSSLQRYLTQFRSLFLVHPGMLFFIGFFLATMYMTNAWDGAIYLMLTAGVLIALYWPRIGSYKKNFEAWKIVWGRDILMSILLIIAGFAIFTLPYNIFFKPFVSGIGVLCAPTFLTKMGHIGPLLFEPNHCQKSYWWELLMLYGFFYFFVSAFVLYLWRRKDLVRSDIFALILIIVATMLIIIPEFIYVKDIYPEHYRANTMFKLVFQAFMMLSIASAYIIVRLLWFTKRAGGWKAKVFFSSFAVITVVMLGLVMTYPYLAIKAYYGDLKVYHGLDGTTYLKTLYPSDYEAMAWINTHIIGQPVILEAQGDSYTDYGRVSINTGLPTVLGWTVHEWLWRGTYDIPAPRIGEIQTMYETKDVNTAQQLLKKYNVSYVFVGAMEFQKYPQLDQEKFAKIGRVVFQNGNTKIYQIF